MESKYLFRYKIRTGNGEWDTQHDPFKIHKATSLDEIYRICFSGFSSYRKPEQGKSVPPSLKTAIICPDDFSQASALYSSLYNSLNTHTVFPYDYVPADVLEAYLQNEENAERKIQFDNFASACRIKGNNYPKLTVNDRNKIQIEEPRCIGGCYFPFASESEDAISVNLQNISRFQILLPILASFHPPYDVTEDVPFWRGFTALCNQFSHYGKELRKDDEENIIGSLSACTSSSALLRNDQCRMPDKYPQHFRFLVCFPFGEYELICKAADKGYLPFVSIIIQIQHISGSNNLINQYMIQIVFDWRQGNITYMQMSKELCALGSKGMELAKKLAEEIKFNEPTNTNSPTSPKER